MEPHRNGTGDYQQEKYTDTHPGFIKEVEIK